MSMILHERGGLAPFGGEYLFPCLSRPPAFLMSCPTLLPPLLLLFLLWLKLLLLSSKDPCIDFRPTWIIQNNVLNPKSLNLFTSAKCLSPNKVTSQVPGIRIWKTCEAIIQPPTHMLVKYWNLVQRNQLQEENCETIGKFEHWVVWWC